MKNYAFILAGGRGERLWPLSRLAKPKQLIKIFSNKTLIEETIERLKNFIPEENIFIVCNSYFAELIHKNLPSTKYMNFIIEPEPRNSAPAIFLAAAFLEKIAPDGNMIILPSDHYISPTDKFQNTLKEAVSLANKNNSLVTIGIKPSYPETGYGYIIVKDNFEIERFTEKPDINTANEYIKQGNAYWNSGIFIWNVRTIKNALKKIHPDEFQVYEEIKKLDIEKITTGDTGELFSKFVATSIDYSIMEKAENVNCIPAQFIWNDVGSWASLEKVVTPDKDNNVLIGDKIISIESNNNIIYDRDNLICTIGVNDLIIVSIDDITLVADKKQAQKVKDILKKIKENKDLEHYL